MKTYTQSSCPRSVRLIAAALLCSLPMLLPAEEPLSTTAERLDKTALQHGDNQAATAIGTKFTAFAGSEENAGALIQGLRNGTPVELTSLVADQTVITSFQPATGKLGYGNTFISLALAQKTLAESGITQPTPAQIVAALNGGTVTGSDGVTATLAGVLTLRAAGGGWGDIARSLGVKLGPIVSQLHAVNNRINHPGRPAVVGNPDHAARSAVPPVRPDVAGRPMMTGNPGASHRPMVPPGQLVRSGKP